MADFTVTTQAAPGHDHVTVISYERAPHNYFTPGLIGVLADTLEELAGDGRTRAVVLRADGRHFCAGADFSGTASGDGDGDSADGRSAGKGDVDLNVETLYGHAIRMFAQPLPIVAQLQGAVIGGGLGLALAADFRVAAERTRLTANFSRIGIHQGFGLTVTLPRLVGEHRAAELLLTGRNVRPPEALAIGLIDAIDDAEDIPKSGWVSAEAVRLAAELAGNAPLAVRSIRETLRQGLVGQIRAAVGREASQQRKLFTTSDFREGVTAAAEHRPANFTAS
ncbi:MAG TPA: enoyl-CoA hydratase/isomerase family protein [Trebonia sp.]|jgi:enoyl-CoA hydratase/carnithine racemase